MSILLTNYDHLIRWREYCSKACTGFFRSNEGDLNRKEESNQNWQQ